MIKREIYLHFFKRLIILVLFGLLANGLLFRSWGSISYYSVLSRIAFAWFFAALIVYHANIKSQIIWFAGFLLSYWAMMQLIPVPGFGAGNLSLEGNFAGYVDRFIFPHHLNYGVFDSEGSLATLPAISTCLLGVFTGHFLKNSTLSFSPLKKGLILGAAGIVLLIVGKIWDLTFPINKKLWTSSFVIYAGGWSVILMSIFYLVIDVWKLRKWAFPFKVIGLNSILIYLTIFGIINFRSTRDFFFTNFIAAFNPAYQALVGHILYLLICWVFLYFLYRKKIFLKI